MDSTMEASGSTQIHPCRSVARDELQEWADWYRRWDWCQRHYGSLRDLEDHVVGEHVAHEMPIDASQVKLRADGKWISLEPSAFPIAVNFGLTRAGSLFRQPTDSMIGSAEDTTTNSEMTHSSTTQHSHQPTSSNPSDPSFPLAEFLDFPPSPHSTVAVPPGQSTPDVSMSSSGSAPLPTQPPAPFLPFGAAQGDEKKRVSGVRHSWGLGGH